MKLVNDDFLNVAKTIPDESIDCVITDCPYHIISGGISIKENVNEPKGVLRKRFKSDGTSCSNKWLKKDDEKYIACARNGKMFEHNDIKFSEWLPEVYRVLKQNTHCYIMINSRNLMKLQQEAEKVGFEFQNLLVWEKQNCLGGNTQILIRNKKVGLIYRSNLKDLYRNTIKQNNITDYQIVGDDGCFKDIKNIFKNGMQCGVCITFRNGQKIFATKEHKFITNDGLKKVSDLKIGDIVKTVKTNIPNNNSEIYNYDLGRFLGIYLAEGYIQENTIDLSVNRDDDLTIGEHIRKVAVRYNAKYHKFKSNKNYYDRHRITSMILKGVIQEFISGDNAKTKHFKRELWNTNVDFLQGVLDGYLESDGSFEKNGKKTARYKIGFTRNKELEYDLRVLCDILDYKMTAKNDFSYIKEKKYSSIRGTIVKRDTNNKLQRQSGEIIAISNSYYQDVYDLEVNGNHLYSLIGGFVTHNCTPSQFYMQNAEFILLLRKGRARYINNLGTKTVLNVPNIIGNKLHPTEKPVDLMRIFVENSTNENDIVLDPFMGSGSTGVACKIANRDFIGVEIDKIFFDTAKKRIESELKQYSLF